MNMFHVYSSCPFAAKRRVAITSAARPGDAGANRGYRRYWGTLDWIGLQWTLSSATEPLALGAESDKHLLFLRPIFRDLRKTNKIQQKQEAHCLCVLSHCLYCLHCVYITVRHRQCATPPMTVRHVYYLFFIAEPPPTPSFQCCQSHFVHIHHPSALPRPAHTTHDCNQTSPPLSSLHGNPPPLRVGLSPLLTCTLAIVSHHTVLHTPFRDQS